MKSDIIENILTIVSAETEISKEEIKSKCKQADVVDARCIFIYHAFKFGIPSISIAKHLLRRKKCVVNQYLRNYDAYYKQSLSFRLMSIQVYQKLCSIYPDIDYKV